MKNNTYLKILTSSFIINIFVTLIVVKSYFSFIPFSNYTFANIYIILSTLSHFMTLLLPAYIITLITYYIFKKPKISNYIFILLMTLTLIGLKIDNIVFSQFRYHLSPFVFRLVFGEDATDIFQFSGSSIFQALFFILVLILIQFLILKFIEFLFSRFKFGLVNKISMYFLFGALIFSHIAHAWADASYYRPITQISQVYPLYYPLIAKKFIYRNNIVDKKEVSKNKNIYKINTTNNIKYPLSEIISKPYSNKKNILFIIVDSWRYDMMDSVVTPNIYKLSLRSQNFNKHFSGSNGTDAGIFSLFYGFNGLYWDQFSRLEKSPVLIDEFQKQNYKLNIFASASLKNPTFDKNVFAGISNLRSKTKGKSPSERDINITREFNTTINNDPNKKFFGFLFYDAAHGFDYPKDYPLKFKPSLPVVNFLALDDNYDAKPFINRYKNALHFIDDEIGKVIDNLENNNLMDSTIIVLTGDHGQEFNDNKKGYWQHGGNYSKYQIQVPMLIFDAEKKSNTYLHQTLHYDISATIMKEYLHIVTPISDFSTGKYIYDKHSKKYFLCGYNNNYAIVEKDRITKVFTTGVFEVTDLELNKLENEEIHYKVIKDALKDLNRFYVKKK